MCAKLDTTGLLADLVYDYVRGEYYTGHGQARLYRRADGGYWMTDELDLDMGELPPYEQYVEVRANADWNIETLDIRLPRTRLDGAYRIEGRILKGVIQTEQTTIESTVPIGSEALLTFYSLWADVILLHRLKLASGQARNAEFISLSPRASLQPEPLRRRCECIGPERLATALGDLDTTHYVVADTHHLWADARGLIVMSRRALGPLPDMTVLSKYHWLGEP